MYALFFAARSFFLFQSSQNLHKKNWKRLLTEQNLRVILQIEQREEQKRIKEKIPGSSSKVQKLSILPEGREKPLTIITQ